MKLLIAIVNWNGRDMLRACLRSVLDDCANLDLRVCVVDNASDDGSVEMLGREFPSVRVLVNDDNLGFAKACNRALRESEPSEYVLFLNPDTLAAGGAIARMVAALDARPDAGAATCSLTGGRSEFQGGQGHRFPTVRTTLNQYLFLNRLLSDRWFPGIYWARRPAGSEIHVDWISGAAMLVRRAAIRGDAFFNELYFMYAEDMEASKDLAASGWKLLFLPDASMTHFMKGSIKKSPERVFQTQISSQLLYLRRNASPLKYRLLKNLMLAGFSLRWLAYGALNALRSRAEYAERARHQRAYIGSLLRSTSA
ncbi:MAG: glycosyltransferase family 2 protein [Elusimicrobia bacterium]|nr:glycosyltransferase family 2 protein [Elusimicrobiota bacterium]